MAVVEVTPASAVSLAPTTTASNTILPAAGVPGLTITGTNGASLLVVNYTRGQGIGPGAYGVFSGGTILSTDTASALTLIYSAFKSTVTIGDATHAAVGTAWGAASQVNVVSEGNVDNELTPLFTSLSYNQTAGLAGRGWGADRNVHGAVAIQQKILVGDSNFVNNYYNGQPVWGDSVGLSIQTMPGTGGGTDAAHNAATTYPVGVGAHVTGYTTGGTQGFVVGFRAGGTGNPWAAGGAFTPRLGTGFEAKDWETAGFHASGRFAGSTGPSFKATNPNATDIAEQLFVGVEANPRSQTDATGLVTLGPGGATAPDAPLFTRFAANTIRTASNFQVNNSSGILVGGATNPLRGYTALTEAQPRVMLSITALSFGPGVNTAPTQVVTTRQTGWAAATNTKLRTTFDTTTVTLPNLAARVGALIDDLITHGLIGA